MVLGIYSAMYTSVQESIHHGASSLNTPLTIEQFLIETEKRAFRMARIATGNTDDALDIVQDAMTRLVHKYAQRPAAEWGPLFHCILQSVIRDWYRRQQIRNRWRQFWPHDAEEDPMDKVMDADCVQPDQQQLQDAAMGTLNAALNELPLRQQQAFLLRYWEELSVTDAARAMKCSEGSVKTHCSRAVNTLRKKLENDWP
jgi:RNA polymerase sigma-70 factor, ECF subfamily